MVTIIIIIIHLIYIALFNDPKTLTRTQKKQKKQGRDIQGETRERQYTVTH